MTIREFNKEQYKELCQRYITEFLADSKDETTSPSYYDLCFADELVSKDIIYSHYDGIKFTKDDFFCGKED